MKIWDSVCLYMGGIRGRFLKKMEVELNFCQTFWVEIWLEISPQMSMDFAFAICPTFLLQICVNKLDDKAKRQKLCLRNRPHVACILAYYNLYLKHETINIIASMLGCFILKMWAVTFVLWWDLKMPTKVERRLITKGCKV